MAEKTVTELWQELKESCEKTNTRLSGMEYLVKNYYMETLDWSERQALEYALSLFHNGTIQEIKLLGQDGEEI